MLKISVQEIRNLRGLKVRLILEGKLSGPWVEELENAWSRANEERAASIIVDLKDVAFVSETGEKLLRRLHREGTKLIAGNLLTRCCVEDIESASSNGADEA